MTDDRALLIETVAEILAAHCAPHVMPLVITWQPELWADLESTGFTLVGVSEDAGGMGGDLVAACDVLREVARASAAVPFGESTLLAAHLLAEAGGEIPSGPLGIALLDGDRQAHVPFGRVASAVVVVESTETSSRTAVLEAGSYELVQHDNLADEPRDDLQLSVEPVSWLDLTLGREEIRQRAALVKAVAISGALEGVLAQSVKYAREREQFGRPLARFQSIQEMLAELAGEAASVRSAVDAAISLSGTRSERFAVAAAKARASEAVDRSCRIGHQIHGALGFTDEHVLGRLTRRLWAWRDEAGNEQEWGEELGRLASGEQTVWELASAATAGGAS